MTDITFVDTEINAAPASPVVTFTSMALGVADATRIIALAISNQRDTGTPDPILSVTIAGISANKAVAETFDGTFNHQTEIWYAQVPTGTTGDVVITNTNTLHEIAVSVYRIIGSGTALHDTDRNNNSLTSISLTNLTVPDNGCAVFAFINEDQAADVVWTGATEDADATLFGDRYSAAHTSNSGTNAITADTTAGDQSIVGASFGASSFPFRQISEVRFR